MSKSTFVCPVKKCTSKAHLFGPRLFTDHCIQELIKLTKTTISPCSRPPTPDSTSSSSSLVNLQHNDIYCLSSHLVLECHCCSHIVNDPITTHCGHTFCRLCVLQMKVSTGNCLTCSRPLPNYIKLESQAYNYTLESVKYALKTTGSLPYYNTMNTSHLSSASWQESDITLFAHNNIILPHQASRLAVFTPQQLHQLRRAIVPSSRYNGICLAVVHKGLPNVAHYGTLVKVISVEHRQDAIILDIIGLERFKVNSYYSENDLMIANIEVQNDEEYTSQQSRGIYCDDNEYIQALSAFGFISPTNNTANNIHQQILSMASASHATSLNLSTEGLLGSVWFKNMQSLHGPLPSPKEKSRLCWWVAAVLPSSAAEKYALLCIESQAERLEVLSRSLTQLENQWTRCRSSAINAYSQVILQQQ
ncbi:PUA-like domain-containing protein [Spinellus fusiger]|nr:PUA-like domain-containing protein [Spinellus fusiger]